MQERAVICSMLQGEVIQYDHCFGPVTQTDLLTIVQSLHLWH